MKILFLLMPAVLMAQENRIAKSIDARHMQMPLPLFFEANQGQAPSDVKFLAHHGGMSVLLENSGAVLRLPSSEIHMKLMGEALQAAIPEAVDPTQGVSGYFFGNEPDKWKTNIPQSHRVRYKQVYPGVDLVFRASTDNRFEYDFVVAPGADPSKIEFRFDGAQSVEADGAGGIILRTADGKILEPRPKVYQDFDGVRKETAGRMILGEDHTVRFELGDYDRRRVLVIDPLIIQWLVFGTVDDQFGGIGRDSAGNVYVTGHTKSAGLPATTIGSPTPNNYYHVFVAKLSPDLTTLFYYVVIGGISNDYAYGLSVDSIGNSYVVGTTNSGNFPVLHGAQNTFGSKDVADAAAYGNDAFVLKLNPAGNALVFSTFLGGDGDDGGSAITVDATGAVYATGGMTSPSNFPVTSGAVSTGPVLYQDTYNAAVWVAKISPDGGTFDYVAVFGASSIITPTSIAIDSSGNAYVGGYVASQGAPADFPIAGHPIQPTRGSNTYDNGFVTEINSRGNALVLSTYFGGSQGAHINGMGLDTQNNIYVTGLTLSTDLPITAGAIVPSFTPNQTYGAAFIASLNNSATSVVACSYLGPATSLAYGLIFPSKGVVGVVGGSGTTFAGVQPQPGLTGVGPIYVTLDPLFQHLLSSFSPNVYAVAYTGAAVAPDGSVAVAGGTQLLPTTSGSLEIVNRSAPVVLVVPGTGGGTVNTNPSILAGGVASAAAFGGSLSIAPGTWIEIFGSNLATDSRSWAATDFNGSNAPTTLDGTKVTIGGIPAFIDYIGTGQNGQVNALVPSNVPTGQQSLIVTTPSGSTSAYMVNVNTIQPGLLAPASFKIGGVQYAVAIFPDGSYALPTGAIPGVASRPAKPGDTVTLYGIGFGAVTPGMNAGVLVSQQNHLAAAFSMSVAGASANLSYYGLAPGYTGLYQFNMTIPQVTPGNSALTFNLGGSTGSQTLFIATGN